MKEKTYRNHFLDVMNIEVQYIARAGPTIEVFVRFDYPSTKVLELFIGEVKHGNIVFRILGRLGLEGPIKNAAVELLG